jgi:hypothetical protein
MACGLLDQTFIKITRFGNRAIRSEKFPFLVLHKSPEFIPQALLLWCWTGILQILRVPSMGWPSVWSKFIHSIRLDFLLEDKAELIPITTRQE